MSVENSILNTASGFHVTVHADERKGTSISHLEVKLLESQEIEDEH